MRAALANYLLKVHELLRDQSRDRGVPPGSALERDLQELATALWLHSERRVRAGPYGGVYYSGLRPETDLFVYDGPAFLHLEAKDISGLMARAIPTEFWARALDLHLGRVRDTLPGTSLDHHPVLVAASSVTEDLRAACIRWGISLLEPQRLPFAVLGCEEGAFADSLRESGCSIQDLRWACLPFSQRFPRCPGGVTFTFGPFRSNSTVRALLRFQRIATAAKLAQESGRRSSPRKISTQPKIWPRANSMDGSSTAICGACPISRHRSLRASPREGQPRWRARAARDLETEIRSRVAQRAATL